MQKKRRGILFWVVGTLLCGVMVTLLISAVAYGPAYLFRVIAYGDSDVMDFQRFPERVIQKSTAPAPYERRIDKALDAVQVDYLSGSVLKTAPLGQLVTQSDTTSLLIVKDDVLVYENYGSGFDADDVFTSFSMSKSLMSLMVGKALEEGRIQSLDQVVKDFVPALGEAPAGQVTLRSLLRMESMLRYDQGFLWFGDGAKSYYMPNLRDQLGRTRVDPALAGRFHYNNYNPQLLGLVLEAVTDTKISDYFQRMFWEPLGAEFDASWSLDGDESAFEKCEAGFNFKPVDMLKVGSMVLHDGVWNDRQIMGSDWIRESTRAAFPRNEEAYAGSFLEHSVAAYQYMWYTRPTGKDDYDVYAAGKSGQYLYISPQNGAVILRTGRSDGGVSNWPETLGALASALGEKPDMTDTAPPGFGGAA